MFGDKKMISMEIKMLLKVLEIDFMEEIILELEKETMEKVWEIF